MYIHTTDLHKYGLRRYGSLATGLACLILFSAGCGAETNRVDGDASRASVLGASEPQAQVRLGVDVLLSDSLHFVVGRRVGLITNHTGLDGSGTATIDRLDEHPDVELVVLFSPEHGIRGVVEAGVKVDSSRDPETGLPIHSLYGATRKPSPEMLANVDVLVFDIQDVGARYYTYLPSMALAMEAAGEAGIPFVVLDRPNPIGGEIINGNILEPAFSSFVGLYPMPMRHGLTAAEFALMAVGEFGVSVDLRIAPMDGWTRSMGFDDTGLDWRAPSPNMPSVTSALHYPGTCLFEGTNLSVGRGTDIAFQQIGAPWLDEEELALNLAALAVPDALFLPIRFTPSNPGDGKFGDEEVGGIRIVADGPRYDPTEAALALLVETRALSGDQWEWKISHFDRLAGTATMRVAVDAGATHHELREGWTEALTSFETLRAPYLLYR